MQYTKEIETPVGKHKVVIKTMLTGAEREQVDLAPTAFLETTDGENFTSKDTKAVASAAKHELLKLSIVSIDGDATDCFARLGKMWEPDYAFVYSAIRDEQKKMKASIFPSS